MDKETRTIQSDIEIRKADDGSETITGYAIVFNRDSQDLGGFIERIEPEAMSGADVSDVVALFNHDPNIVLGRIPETLSLTVDAHGVRYDIKPPNTSAASDVKESIRRRDVRGSSFAFTVKQGGDRWQKPKVKGEPYTRTITQFDRIFDVSPVTYPAYRDTDTTVAKRELGMERDRLEREESDQLEREQNLAKTRLDIYYKKMRLNLHKHEEE
jgi:hypothetical protein